MTTVTERVSADRSGSPLPLAGWWLRFGAYMVDSVVVLGIAVVLFFLAWAASGDAAVAGVIGWAASEYVIRGLVYAPLLMRRHGRHNGQTLGKQLAGIRVIREDARPADYRSAVMREWVAKTLVIQIGGMLLTGGLAILLDYLWPIGEERNQALHDRIASTLVVETE